MESEFMKELRKKIDMRLEDGPLPQKLCEDLAKKYQKNIEEDILPQLIQESLKNKFYELLLRGTTLSYESTEKLIEEFIQLIRVKISYESGYSDYKHIVNGDRVEIDQTGAIIFTSKVSNKKLTTKLSEETASQLDKIITNMMPVASKEELCDHLSEFFDPLWSIKKWWRELWKKIFGKKENKNLTNLRAYLNCPRPKVSEAYKEEYKKEHLQ